MEQPDRLFAAAVFREEALRAGFVRVGFARAQEPPRFELFRDWIEKGRHAGMGYLERTAGARAHPEELLPGARSIICLAASHETHPLVSEDGCQVARYAGASADYHGTLRQRACGLVESVLSRLDQPFRFRVCVDSTPIAERSFAAAAGLGWIGKNGCLIDEELGSFLLLAEVLTDLDLPPDEPVAEHCGSCVRCLRACPTDAFVEPGVLDARRCLAYWTIEHHGPLPDDIKAEIGPRVFGCDICQEVCPWNAVSSGAPVESAAETVKTSSPSDLLPTRADWLTMGRGPWRRLWGTTAMNRAGRRAVQRNAAASAGATGDPVYLPLLETSGRSGDTGLSDAARWAQTQLRSSLTKGSA